MEQNEMIKQMLFRIIINEVITCGTLSGVYSVIPSKTNRAKVLPYFKAIITNNLEMYKIIGVTNPPTGLEIENIVENQMKTIEAFIDGNGKIDNDKLNESVEILTEKVTQLTNKIYNQNFTSSYFSNFSNFPTTIQ